MIYVVKVYPNMGGDDEGAFILGEIEAKNRNEVVEILEERMGDDSFVPAEYDYTIVAVGISKPTL